MAKGTICVLLPFALIAVIHCQESWDCKGVKPYELNGDDGDSKYFVCLSQNSDKLYYDCPEDYKFRLETRSCTLELDQVTKPTCSFAGEKFVYVDNDDEGEEGGESGGEGGGEEGAGGGGEGGAGGGGEGGAGGGGEEGGEGGSEGGGEEGAEGGVEGEGGEGVGGESRVKAWTSRSETTCDSYWLCDEELVAQKQTCESGFSFNTLLLECVSNKYWTCAEGSPDCESEDYRNKKWTNKKDCETFYECIGTTPTKRKCPSGYYFNATGQGCLHNINEQCKVPTAWVPAPLVDLENMCKGNVGKFLPDPNYCKAYYYCVSEDTPYWSPCDNDLYFDNGKCVSNAPKTCKCETIDWEKEKVDKVNIPSSDPKKYYYCVKGKVGVEITCPQGMEFDEEEGMCAE
ncbi:unnamed protein product [Hermetia illucens]|uniref:Chitin-binding type-2 domain-containing protein n=1 Tax=Hermetia illucens TaxID=343691 RepID=A0A7R8YPQ6_HERIL|nr:unnamed protein product [Hermetia illucens]